MPNLFCVLIYLLLRSHCNVAMQKTKNPVRRHSIEKFKIHLLDFLRIWYESDNCKVNLYSLSKINHFKLFIFDLRDKMIVEDEFEGKLLDSFCNVLSELDKLPKM